jgi:hypothetical protein
MKLSMGGNSVASLRLLLLLLATSLWAWPPWEIGLGLGRPNPLTFSLGLRPQSYVLRAEGGGWLSNGLSGWGGGRLALGRDWLDERWYGLETNVSAGYFRAQASDSMHIAVNEATGSNILYEANWEETVDVGAELGFRLGILHARVGAPLKTWGNHEPSLFWRLSLLWIFGSVRTSGQNS